MSKLKTFSITLSRTPTVFGDICYILLASGEVALCDARFYNKVKDHTWSLMGNGYPAYTKRKADGSRKTVKLHTLIAGKWVDHKSGNKLDNRLSNLRKATSQQNNANKKKPANCSSRYKGVRWDKSRNKWLAGIEVNGRSKTLGRFETEKDAAKAYDCAASLYFGEFAKLNFERKLHVKSIRLRTGNRLRQRR